MNARFFFFALALTVAAALVATTASAKGSFNCLLLYADGKAILVTDPPLLAFDALNDFSSSIPGSPSVITPGYLIARGAIDHGTGECSAIDTLRFFPSSLGAGSKPVLYYEGLVNGWTEYDGKWYYARPEATAALQQLLLSEPQSAPASSKVQWATLALSALAGIAIGAASTALLKRRIH